MRKPKRFLCIGGPLNGQELSRDEIQAQNMTSFYDDYNASMKWKYHHSCVLIFHELVNIPKKAKVPC